MTPCLTTCPRRRARSFHHTCNNTISSTLPSLQVSAGFPQWQYPESRVFYRIQVHNNINNAVSSPRFFQRSKISVRRWSLADQRMGLHQPCMIRPWMPNNSYAANPTSTCITVGNGRILSSLPLIYNGLNTDEWWILQGPRAINCGKSPFPVPTFNQDLHSTLPSTRSTNHPRSQGRPQTMALTLVAMPTRCRFCFLKQSWMAKISHHRPRKLSQDLLRKTRTSGLVPSRTNLL